MITIRKQIKIDTVPSWHQGFLALLPDIRRHAQIVFRSLPPEAREEAVQAVVCNALVAYYRLVQLGKTDVAYASALARYGVAQTRSGRMVGGRLNIKDVLSVHAQRTKSIHVERLDRYNQRLGQWKEILVEDRTATPADIAASRIDFGNWLQTLTARQRKMAILLASGETTSAAARRFRVSAGRISQVRRELKEAWEAFHQLSSPSPPPATNGANRPR